MNVSPYGMVEGREGQEKNAEPIEMEDAEHTESARPIDQQHHEQEEELERQRDQSRRQMLLNRLHDLELRTIDLLRGAEQAIEQELRNDMCRLVDDLPRSDFFRHDRALLQRHLQSIITTLGMH